MVTEGIYFKGGEGKYAAFYLPIISIFNMNVFIVLQMELYLLHVGQAIGE